jgi:hypothetical protein
MVPVDAFAVENPPVVAIDPAPPTLFVPPVPEPVPVVFPFPLSLQEASPTTANTQTKKT